MSKKILFLSIGGLILFIVGYLFLYNHFNSVDLTITTKNASSYTVKISKSTIHTSSSQVSEIVRVPKHSVVAVEFIGKSGYETSVREVVVKESPVSVSIDPYFSKDHLQSLVGRQAALIESAVLGYQSNINDLYTIEDITLYHFGEWASARLVWKGEYSQNSDNLKILLHKEQNGEWGVAANPSLVYYYKNYPEIPSDILKEANQF